MLSAQTLDFFQRAANRILPYVTVPPDGETENAHVSRQAVANCPKCGGTRLIRNGKRNNRQRFRCKDCGKTIGYSHGTPMYRSRGSQVAWSTFIHLVESGTPLREIAEQCDISLPTACSWRRKYLAGHVRMCRELLKEIEAAGLLAEGTDMNNLLRQIEVKASRIRGRSKKIAARRFRRWQMHVMEKLARRQRQHFL